MPDRWPLLSGGRLDFLAAKSYMAWGRKDYTRMGTERLAKAGRIYSPSRPKGTTSRASDLSASAGIERTDGVTSSLSKGENYAGSDGKRCNEQGGVHGPG